ncbi:serine/threonine-protein kinase [Kineococcus arenarius]|uniref:hypothetical protein n=1 Tax=unclassified Kineococcus TaxID=2621656 RepID=UPI003D7E2EE6
MTEGWPDDGLTPAFDASSVLRHRAGPPGDADRYELLVEAQSADEAWHVLDHRAPAGEALFTLVALRPGAGVDAAAGEGGPAADPAAVERTWRERAAGLVRVRHECLAAVLSTFTGPAPHPPGRAAVAEGGWDYAVLEQAPGRSVADWLHDDPGAGVEERFAVLATAAGVLDELHRGTEHSPPLVHGDITPRTVHLGGFFPGDGVRLAGPSLGGPRRGGPHRSAIVYTAPEVRSGALPSSASDVFGFAATAVFVLTGQPPAADPAGALDPGLVRRQLAASPHTAAHPHTAELLLRGLSPDPHERPDHLPAWVEAMRTLVAPGPVPPGPDGWERAVPAVAAAPRARRVRTLPRRPVAVVVGALVLATAGTAIAITAVQQGRLEEVPNPVAIVQPRPTGVLPTSAPVAPAPATQDPIAGTDPAEDGAADPSQEPVATGRTPARTGGATATAPASGSGASSAPVASPASTPPGASTTGPVTVPTSAGSTVPPAAQEPAAPSAPSSTPPPVTVPPAPTVPPSSTPPPATVPPAPTVPPVPVPPPVTVSPTSSSPTSSSPTSSSTTSTAAPSGSAPATTPPAPVTPGGFVPDPLPEAAPSAATP